jgi:hypothetical protein
MAIVRVITHRASPLQALCAVSIANIINGNSPRQHPQRHSATPWLLLSIRVWGHSHTVMQRSNTGAARWRKEHRRRALSV